MTIFNSDLPEELAAIANGDESLLGLLRLAYDFCDADPAERRVITGTAHRFLPGDLSMRIVLWEDLTEVVAMWRRYDLTLDSSIGVNSREAADEHVWTVLACISRRMNPVGAL